MKTRVCSHIKYRRNYTGYLRKNVTPHFKSHCGNQYKLQEYNFLQLDINFKVHPFIFHNNLGILRTLPQPPTHVHTQLLMFVYPLMLNAVFIREDKILQVIKTLSMFRNMRQAIFDILHNLHQRTVTHIANN